MEIFLFTFILFLLSVFLMAWGVMNGRAPIRGSCGGLSQGCKICQGDATHCLTKKETDDG